MTTINRFALMTGLPEYGLRVNINNVNINDIINYAYELGYDIGIITNTHNFSKLLSQEVYHKICF